MGATNVKLAYATWGSLAATPFRMLAYMALTSLDDSNGTTPARRYFAGRETLAAALGRDVPQEPQDDDESAAAVNARRVRHTAFVTVQANLATLKAAGAICPIRKGRPGRQAEYALNLEPFPKQGDLVFGNKVSESAKQGEQGEQDKPTLSRRNHEEPLEEEHLGQPHLSPSSHQAPTSARDEDLYLAAQKAHKSAGPERSDRLMAQAWAEHPDATTRELVILAADLAGAA